jgi:3-dehydroquinate dehydratase / shikimate dehydrogenase
MTELRTERTLLRHWRDEDFEPFARLNADPEVRRWFNGLLTTEQSNELAARCRDRLDERGWGLWALEVPGVSDFCGFVGLNLVGFATDFSDPSDPAIEVGWRLAKPWWGFGYASESARACLRFAFEELSLAEVVSFTAVGNTNSRAVMERIGMTRDPDDDFDHPELPVDSDLRRHVLYRIASPHASKVSD